MIFFILISVICQINQFSSESLSSKSWSNSMQELTLKFNENPISETNPTNEGFMMIREQSKKSLPCNSSSTMCKTITQIPPSTTTRTTVKSSTALIDHSIGHLGRKLLIEPSYDTDSEMILTDDEIKDLSKQLFNFEITMDGTGETTEDTTQQMTTYWSTTVYVSVEPVLSNDTKFVVELDCTNLNDTLSEILEDIHETLGNILFTYSSDIECNNETRRNLTFTFTTDNDTETITDLIRKASKIFRSNNGKPFLEDICNKTESILVEEVTSCYVINLCSFCGKNPTRGVCLEEKNRSSCECLKNEINPSRPYVGPFCREDQDSPVQTSTPAAQWTPVIIGILGGITGLFVAITASLWALSQAPPAVPNPPNAPVQRLFNLPRAQMPTDGTSPNPMNQLDPDYDPINELDSIIDNEDIDTTFNDPLNELGEQNGPNEFVNPNLRIP